MDRILEKKPFIIRYRNYLIAGVVFLCLFDLRGRKFDGRTQASYRGR